MGSTCRRGLSEMRPESFAVSSPSFQATKPWADSWTETARITPGRLRRIAISVPVKSVNRPPSMGQRMVVRRVPIPSPTTSTTSPGTIGPTFTGVPQVRMSPGSMVKYFVT